MVDNTSNSPDFLVVKLNVDGVQQWVGKYNGSALATGAATAVAADVIDGSGNAYVTVPVAGSVSNIVTIKYSSSGIQSWVAIFNGPANAQDMLRS